MDVRTRKRGFTLVELLVVIAIIAILAGILFPVFVSVKRTVRQSSCSNNMKQLGIAFSMYRSDWGSCFPLGGVSWSGSDYSKEWQNVTWKYIKKDCLYRCPSTLSPDVDPSQPGYVGSNIRNPRTPVTYLYNSSLGSDKSNVAASQVGIASPRNESMVKIPGKCILLMEGFAGAQSPLVSGTDCHGQQNTLWLRDYTFYQGCTAITGGEHAKAYNLPYHNGGNVLFVDGHVKGYKYNNQSSLQAAFPGLFTCPSNPLAW